MRLKDYLGMGAFKILSSPADVEAILRNVSYVEKPDKKGYSKLTIADGNKELSLMEFSLSKREADELCVGKVYTFRVSANTYKDSMSYITQRFECRSDLNPMDYLPIIENYGEYRGEFETLLNNFENKVLISLRDWILERYSEEFYKAPAGKSMHHNLVGGLMQHSLSVAKIAMSYPPLYGGVVNREILLFGALFHDIGKVVEYEFSDTGGIRFSEESALDSHITAGVDILRESAYGCGCMHTDEYRHLKHIILSHHGKKEFGSPVLPATIEALLVSQADMTDALIYCFSDKLSELGTSEKWTGNLMGQYRSVYRF